MSSGISRPGSGSTSSARISTPVIRGSNNNDFVVTTVQDFPDQPSDTHLAYSIAELSGTNAFRESSSRLGDVNLSGMHVVVSPEQPSILASRPSRLTLPQQASSQTRMVYDPSVGVLLDRQTGSRIVASESVASLISQRPDTLPILTAVREASASALALRSVTPQGLSAGEALMDVVDSEPNAAYATSERMSRSPLFDTPYSRPQVSTTLIDDIGDAITQEASNLSRVAGQVSSGIRGTVETTANALEQTPTALLSTVIPSATVRTARPSLTQRVLAPVNRGSNRLRELVRSIPSSVYWLASFIIGVVLILWLWKHMIVQISWGRRRNQSVDDCRRKRSGIIQIGGAQPLADIKPNVAINLGGGEATIIPREVVTKGPFPVVVPSPLVPVVTPLVTNPVIDAGLAPSSSTSGVRGMLNSQLNVS